MKWRAFCLLRERRLLPLASQPGRLLAAGFFQHTQGALVGFVSGLLSFLSGGQGLVSVTVGFVSTSLSAGSGVFGSGQASFAFLVSGAATSGQSSGQSQGGEFQSIVHRKPLEVDILF